MSRMNRENSKTCGISPQSRVEMWNESTKSNKPFFKITSIKKYYRHLYFFIIFKHL